MENILSTVKQLLLLPHETEWVEFKENNSNPQEIGEYISALSNSACYLDRNKAYLVYGIKDGTHTITGTIFNPKIEKKGNQALENWLATQLVPSTDFIIHNIELEGKNVVVFEIDAAKNIPVKFKGEEYIRVGSYKQFLHKFPEKARKIWAKESKEVFEKQIAMDSLSGDEVLKLIDYPAFFDLLKIDLPEDKKGIFEKLESEKVIFNKIQSYSITNFGAILFAKKLLDFESLSRRCIRVIFYNGKSRLETIKEYVAKKGYAIEFESLIEYINDRLPSNEVIGKAFRKEVKMYPNIAIRELIANAIIHQDFSINGVSPMVEIFDDRIEISNPGRPIIDTLRFIDHLPISRNEYIASFMKRINICEERGSGIDKVVNSVEIYQLPAPDFIESDIYFKTVLYAYKPLRQMSKNDKIRACYQHCCLKYVTNDIMTNQSLRERFSIDNKNYSMASRIISDTLEAGLIKKTDRFGEYVPSWT